MALKVEIEAFKIFCKSLLKENRQLKVIYLYSQFFVGTKLISKKYAKLDWILSTDNITNWKRKLEDQRN